LLRAKAFGQNQGVYTHHGMFL